MAAIGRHRSKLAAIFWTVVIHVRGRSFLSLLCLYVFFVVLWLVILPFGLENFIFSGYNFQAKSVKTRYEYCPKEWLMNYYPLLGAVETTCKPRQHVAYLKNHKCGSTTIVQIFNRYRRFYDLRVAEPKYGYHFWGPVDASKIPRPPKIKMEFINTVPLNGTEDKFDMILHHMVYDEEVLKRVMHADTFYTTILREPFSQFKSVFNAFHFDKKYNIFNADPMREFLRNPQKYYRGGTKPASAFVRNSMLFHFGFPDEDDTLRNNITFIKQFIAYIDKKFDFIMISEFMDESLILLRRLLCWDMDDILFASRNVLNYTYKHVDDPELRRLHMQWSLGDYFLYSHFRQKFEKLMKAQGPDFQEELEAFKICLKNFQNDYPYQ
ncbi:galactose-3-O-sulfotransferase 3 [Lingula anatina]|uniref:Galactose-3-O-sulfotransferase 3 n=1 Tax=Lingula anatina TaxID=7574 RepID=A0A1S3H813_LINAN|nr:galactose-3-O-sulfotransferase 3 [Lingula anatina]XP_013382139.1 galactose-3-O-sulfotransferase 3 [Lingula anatina]|eukprot:XP_013382138.1 galactose-3-O-sulfotransferase 3 [Lingula anatina]